MWISYRSALSVQHWLFRQRHFRYPPTERLPIRLVPCFRLAHGAEHGDGLLHDVELIVRRAAHINSRLLERWALELGEDATRLEEALETTQALGGSGGASTFCGDGPDLQRGLRIGANGSSGVYELARDNASVEAWAVSREISAERRQASFLLWVCNLDLW